MPFPSMFRLVLTVYSFGRWDRSVNMSKMLPLFCALSSSPSSPSPDCEPGAAALPLALGRLGAWAVTCGPWRSRQPRRLALSYHSGWRRPASAVTLAVVPTPVLPATLLPSDVHDWCEQPDDGAQCAVPVPQRVGRGQAARAASARRPPRPRRPCRSAGVALGVRSATRCRREHPHLSLSLCMRAGRGGLLVLADGWASASRGIDRSVPPVRCVHSRWLGGRMENAGGSTVCTVVGPCIFLSFF